MNRHSRRFNRQIDRIGRSLPALRSWFGALTAPGRLWLRLPVSLLLMVGGVFSFLPIMGLWMLPLGLVLLAIDLPVMRPGVASLIVRARAFWRRLRR